MRAEISVTWYTWLEQGRPVRVSRQTLASIARALGLSETERAHLLRLADAASAADTRTHVSTASTPGLRRLLASLTPHPAYAVNALWDVLAWNGMAGVLFGDFDAQRGITDNVLRRLFLDPAWRSLFHDWSAIAESAVAQFRAATGHLIADPAWRDHVASLERDSNEFAACWSRHALADALSRTKLVRHPGAGLLSLQYTSLHPDAEAPDVRVIVYTADDDEAADALRSLGAVGARSLESDDAIPV